MQKLAKYQQAIDEQAMQKGMVKLVQYDKDLETDILGLDLDGVKCIIKRDEIDDVVKWRSLAGFLGREIDYIIQSIDEEKGVLYASRKAAQAIRRPSIIEQLEEGEVVQAQIINLLKYGAYVEYEGVTGLLKNQDFAADHTAVSDVKKMGETVSVRLRKVSENGRLLFEAEEKYANPTIMSFDMFERDQIVFGSIRNVKSWGVFVRIAPNLDALCPIPPTTEIEEGMKVSFRITQVDTDKARIRGKILRVLS